MSSTRAKFPRASLSWAKLQMLHRTTMDLLVIPAGTMVIECAYRSLLEKKHLISVEVDTGISVKWPFLR